MNVSASSALRHFVCVALLSSFGHPVFAQAAAKVPANWTDDMPSVAKVEQQVQGTDPTDTLERQVAVFEYLQVYVRRIKETRDYKGPFTPGETQLMTDYAKAQYDLQQGYYKTHSQQEIAAFGQKEGQYSINNALDWIKQLQGNNSAVAYSNTEADLHAAQQRNDARIQKDLDQSGGGGLMGGMIAGGALDGEGNSPRSASSLSPDQRRCLELGDSYTTCVGPGGVIGALGDLLTAALPANTAPQASPTTNGVVLVGLYHSRTDMAEIEMWSGGNSTLTKCGSLVDNMQPYTIHKSGGTIQIIRPNEPNPIVLTLQSDGTMTGPGTIQVKGSIITGYNNVTACTNTHGYVAGNCSTTSTPILQAKMDTCRLSQLSPQPLPPPTLVSTGAAVGPSPPNGFWITGDYASSNGMQLSFGAPPYVILDCGQAHVKVPYTVTNTPTQFVIQIQNGKNPFQLVVAPDNTLRGSGSVTIDGKLVSSLNGSNVFYTPHSETCSIASFSPKGKLNTMVASNGPMPALPAASVPAQPVPVAASTSSASAPAPIADALAGAGISATPSTGKTQLRVLLSSSFAGTNPLAGQAVFVSRKPMDQILRELGVSVPANATPAQAMKALQTLCHSSQGCTPVMQKLPTYYVTTAKLDTAGKATLNATAASGAYYFFAIVPSNGGSMMWDLAANLAAGDNSVTFTASNAQQVQ